MQSLEQRSEIHKFAVDLASGKHSRALTSVRLMLEIIRLLFMKMSHESARVYNHLRLASSTFFGLTTRPLSYIGIGFEKLNIVTL